MAVMQRKSFLSDITIILAGALLLFVFSAGLLPAHAGMEEVNNMTDNLHWLGHDTFRLDASKVIYFDPYELPQGSKKADIIFVTHEHYDHYSPADIALISTKDTAIVTDKTVAGKLKGTSTAYKQIIPLSPGEIVEIYGVKVLAVASYNINKPFHTKDSKKLGYIITLDGLKIYHAGDTDFIPEMKNIQCDIALLPVSGIYVMTADEAAEAALAIKPKLAIPMHYGSIVGSDNDARRFQDLLKGKIEVKVLKKER